MDIALDAGNTLVKVALFERDKLMLLRQFEHKDYAALVEFIAEIGANQDENVLGHALISSTIGEIREINDILKSLFNVIIFDSNIKIPIVNCYSTKETLGGDRLASVVGGVSLFPDRNVLTINLGTCIIYDFINQHNEYIGGGISPGLMQRLRSLNHFTAKLPLVNIDRSISNIELIGTDTNSSITTGVVNGMKFEIEGFINSYKNIYNDVKVIISGGDLRYFKGIISCEYECIDDLVITGLHEILKYNKKIK